MAHKPARRPTVFAVLPWRGDGRYKLDQAIRVFLRRSSAESFAEKDPAGNLCVRELDAPVNISVASLILKAFREAYASDARNLERQKDRPPFPVLTGLRVVANPDDPGECWISNDQEEFYQVVADLVYGYRFVQQI